MCDECAHEQPRFLHVFYLMMFDLPPSPHAWGSYACAFCASVFAPRVFPPVVSGYPGNHWYSRAALLAPRGNSAAADPPHAEGRIATELVPSRCPSSRPAPSQFTTKLAPLRMFNHQETRAPPAPARYLCTAMTHGGRVHSRCIHTQDSLANVEGLREPCAPSVLKPFISSGFSS